MSTTAAASTVTTNDPVVSTASVRFQPGDIVKIRYPRPSSISSTSSSPSSVITRYVQILKEEEKGCFQASPLYNKEALMMSDVWGESSDTEEQLEDADFCDGDWAVDSNQVETLPSDCILSKAALSLDEYNPQFLCSISKRTLKPMDNKPTSTFLPQTHPFDPHTTLSTRRKKERLRAFLSALRFSRKRKRNWKEEEEDVGTDSESDPEEADLVDPEEKKHVSRCKRVRVQEDEEWTPDEVVPSKPVDTQDEEEDEEDAPEDQEEEEKELTSGSDTDVEILDSFPTQKKMTRRQQRSSSKQQTCTNASLS